MFFAKQVEMEWLPPIKNIMHSESAFCEQAQDKIYAKDEKYMNETIQIF